MSQNPLDDVLILNATVRRSDDDLSGPTAPIANLYIDTEYALESLSSDHRGRPLPNKP
jgi:hypothetical protein